jgi:two-component system phosphate regulon response regulator PhoB
MKRVIVAEDDFVISKLYQIHFKRNGIHGSFFTTGAGVIQSARHEKPDLVILDFELPDLRGPEVMRELRQIEGCADVPVIFVTGRATPEVVENLRKEGASEVFGKPFSPLHLIHLIKTLTSSNEP